jgi:acetyl esterase/lipase
MERLIHEGGKPLPQLSIEAARQYTRDSQPTPLPHVSITIETTETSDVPLTLVRPSNTHATLPAILYLHGGGWALGGIATHARIVRELALRAQAVIAVPEYSLSPEAHFPVALEECYTTACWLQSQGAAHNIAADRLAVAGDSAGGNLAAALALLTVRRGGPAFRLQALLCPALQASSSTDSYRDFAEGLNLTKDAMDWFWEQYITNDAQRPDPLVSPLQASPAELARLAPAFIITAECDVLRDEGEQYAKRLMEAGVDVTAARYLGTLHNFPVIDGLQDSGPASTALLALGNALRLALHGNPSLQASTHDSPA